jgi:leucyl-tRNA synthetase
MTDKKFNPKDYEAKWQKRWQDVSYDNCDINNSDKKFYCLDMFPYPSGSGLHVGHPRGYVLSDVLSRYKKMKGYNILHPMGWDAFGLPAENDAIKKKIHPKINTDKNIANFTKQLKKFGCMYDWSREVSTCEPDYYKWTQWIFVKMFKAGLAYRRQVPINWCRSCKTGLANEEVVNGACERCGEQVIKKDLMQWMLRITNYAERLLNDLQKLDWPDSVKNLQANWIGRSEGAEIKFKIISARDGQEFEIKVFTTRPDTLFGATYMVLAPEHPLVQQISASDQQSEIESYQLDAKKKSDLQRAELDKDKSGVFTGAYAVNPVNNQKIPVWISDYVLMSYGTGAIMAVPAHDERDFEFATKFGLKIIEVIHSKDASRDNAGKLTAAFISGGVMVNSGEYNGIDCREGKRKITKDLQQRDLAEFKVNYKLRDWVFSRQRYWGEPIPIIHCKTCGEVVVPEEDLPVKLPRVKNYEPTGTGESPLALIESWVNTTCPVCNKPAKRETNTMPQWAGSCWYFLRYISPDYDKGLFDPTTGNKWMPVDQYVGGIEHAILHLLYARFYIKFLYDIDAVKFDEPFKKLFCIGMVTRKSEKSGKIEKMSKSRGNVVNPDIIINQHGTDTLRLYELFIGPPELDSEWSDSGIIGIYKFLKRVWYFVHKNLQIESFSANESPDVTRIRHKLIYDITQRIEKFKFNTAISAFMEFVNVITRTDGGKVSKDTIKDFLTLLAPFAPHLACELWESMGFENLVLDNNWPEYDPKFLIEDQIEIGVQIKGKFRGSIKIAKDADQKTAMQKVREVEAINKYIEGQNIKKIIYIPAKILNIIV